MVIKEMVRISTLGNLKRTLHIYVPDHLKKDQRCSVLYMFDGHNLFYDEDATYGTSWGLKEFFDTRHYPLIIVGIECNHKGNERLKEFSPYDFHDPVYGEIDGKGKQIFQWIVQELKPCIDAKYPTLKDRYHTAIGGSSMGGLMAMYGGIVYSNVFSRALCLSPYVYYVTKDILKDLKKESINSDTDFYISYGSKECRSVSELVYYTERLFMIERAINNRARVYLHLFKGHEHSESAWAKETAVWTKELSFHKN